MLYNDKPYYSLDYKLKQEFGEKVYKISLDGGMTCPNRDGLCGDRGCIFCSSRGSGDFSFSVVANEKNSSSPHIFSQDGKTYYLPTKDEIWETIDKAKEHISDKFHANKYIAYYQSYTNTYAPIEVLENLFANTISNPDIVVLSIATRPDCLSDEIIELLTRLNKIKPVWVELGLQTIHEETATFIRRGYKLPVFETSVKKLQKNGIEVIVHVILGLPQGKTAITISKDFEAHNFITQNDNPASNGETSSLAEINKVPIETNEMIFETINYLNSLKINGIKLQLLHILKHTDLATFYENHHFHVYTEDEYINLVINIIERLEPIIVIHRLTGDGNSEELIEPKWSLSKRHVLNTIHKKMKELHSYQGKLIKTDLHY
jgi:radical SAM protein (TIGR01212 family)